MVARVQPIYVFLVHKWYFDELYDFLFVRPAMWIGYHLWQRGDRGVIDGFGPDGIAAASVDIAQARRCACRPATSITTRSPC